MGVWGQEVDRLVTCPAPQHTCTTLYTCPPSTPVRPLRTHHNIVTIKTSTRVTRRAPPADPEGEESEREGEREREECKREREGEDEGKNRGKEGQDDEKKYEKEGRNMGRRDGRKERNNGGKEGKE